MKILVIGDSTGVSASHSATEFTGVSPWTECVIAGKLLDEKFGAGTFTFINKSKGGSGFGDWLYGSSEYGTQSFSELISENPDVGTFYVQLGINNAIRNGTTSGVTYAVQQMFNLCVAAGKNIIFATPNPVDYPGRPEVNVLLWNMKNAIISKCSDLGVPVVDHWAAAAATGVWRDLLSDGIHPNEDYYRFKGQTLFMTLAYL